MNNIIKSVGETSPLRRCVRPGDALVAVNGKRILDVLDYKYYAYEPRLLLQFYTAGGKHHLVFVRKPEGSDLGLEFESYLMDRPRSCANGCVFCFIDQNPPGMRESIYFQDDDARLSFLMGCYITLTNLSRREIQRVIDLHVSPINISVHTTDPELRRKLLRNPRAEEVMEVMRRFAEAGIRMNCQIVCCPGLNDGAALLRTLKELRGLFPAVTSISVVPVGLTAHREGLCPLSPFTPEGAEETVAAVERFGETCLSEIGTRLAWCSDELYQRAGLPLPPEGFYEDYTQLENGVGMLRLLETEFTAALERSSPPDGAAFSIATGAAAAPLLSELLERAREKYPALNGRVYTIINRFYGESVTVSGLLTGTDLISQLRGQELGERLLISADMLRREEVDFLDSVTLAEAAAALGIPIYPVPCDGGRLCDAMLGILPPIPAPQEGAEATKYNKYV